jgi:hypothetical protein
VACRWALDREEDSKEDGVDRERHGRRGRAPPARHLTATTPVFLISGEQQAEKGLGALCEVSGVGGGVVWGEE